MVLLTLLPPAEADLLDAKLWYEKADPALSDDFKHRVAGALSKITDNPLAFPLITDRLRRALIGRFPYHILYFLESNHVYVIGVLNQRRNPTHWQSRTH
ncbi:MAG: type II toxin-antitoxin system RelE/ParE family toxin [Alphaproteobacteria bacterium]|nr:type II toxin-antitoxin system RelE/ParE family toxin [Alphaproteobacteria bacterium]